MRNLTIKRADSFIGKFAKYKVYIEDHSKNATLTIKGTPCSKLGELKSGEEKTFEITNEKVRIFVIADKITKDICNDFCTLPQGNDNIMLAGKAQFNLFNFNAFIFYGKPSREMIRNRKDNKKIGAIILSACVFLGFIIGLIVGCNGGPKKQNFEHDNMQITLTDEFESSEVNGWDFCFSSNDVTIFGKKEAFADYPILEGFNLKEYSTMLLSNSKLDDSVELRTSDDIYYFSYEMQNVGGKLDLTYYVMTFKANDGFWFINFTCPSEKVETLSSELFKYAGSVKFK